LEKKEMRININLNIEKKYAFLIVGLIIAVGLVIGVSAWDSAKKMWHSADDVKVVIGGNDYSLQEAIDNGTIGGKGGNIRFITPVLVGSSSSNTIMSWTTFDASSYIPSSASVVILEAGAQTDRQGDQIAYINIRADANSSSYRLLEGDISSASGNVVVSWANQGIYPINNLRFQYNVTSPSFTRGWDIKLIGYIY